MMGYVQFKSVSYPIAGFDINGVKASDSTTEVLVSLQLGSFCNK
jgi:hypothetical protein